jgi:uncharacterized protein YeaO (DUF488 family)
MTTSQNAAASAQWEAFVRDYVIEMEDQRGLIHELRLRHEHGETLTLLCGCHDPTRCHRSVLARLILESA